MNTPESAAFADLEALYRDLRSDLQAIHATCSGCGACCRFDEAEHTLFATDLEHAYLLSKEGERPTLRPGRCPYQIDNQCHAREGRYLGCRLYFCSVPEATAATLEKLAQTYHARLRDIHDKPGIDYRYQPRYAP